MGACRGLVSVAILAASLLPSSAFASGVAISAASGERIDVLHNTIASFSAEASTVVEQVLWQGSDQALWVLPLPTDSEVFYSSDALVNLFDQSLAVVVRQPPNSCFSPHVDECFGTGGGGVGGSAGTVFPVADEVAFPSTMAVVDTAADVESWFASFGVTPPADLPAELLATEALGYRFMIMHLPQGDGLLSSPAVRFTSAVAGDAVPMLSPSVDAKINLTLIGERRFASAAQPTTAIGEDDLEWSWTAMESNYYPLADEAIAAGWLAEAGEPLSPYAFDKLISIAATDPYASGYGLLNAEDPVTAATEDADLLRAGLKPGTTWVTRLTTRVPAAGLPLELELEPTDSISVVDRDLTPATETGAIPSCENDSGGCGDDFIGDDMDMGDDVVDCSATRAPTTGRSPLLLLAALLLGLARKRRLPKG